MKSLLSNYFNNRQQNDTDSKQNETTSSFSSLTSSSSDQHQITNQQNNSADSSIKYIDDIDTDAACCSSTDDDETTTANLDLSNKLKSTSLTESKQFLMNQIKSNDTVIKTLEKISENFQFLFEDCKNEPTKIILNKQSNTHLNTNTLSLVDQLKEWFSLINRVTKESQDLYKKKMNENINENNKQTPHDDKTDKLNQQIKHLTDKLNNIETLNKQQKEEIDRLKDICESMRSDRKRLKSEKIDLLNQAKELYSTIETKENELRDFLRHYETKTKETSFAVKKLIDSKASIEQEKIELQTQVFELLEDKNELKLLVESKNATITKLQKQLFEMNTKSIRHSLSKESDYGYVSTKASRDTLSTSLIENLKLNDYDTTKLKLRNKEERMIKCKSNDYQQHQQQQQQQNFLKNKLKNKSHQQFNEIKDCSSQSNSSNQSIIDYESDLNKVLDSEAFIDLDSSSNEKLNSKSKHKQDTISQSYSSDCIMSSNSNCMKQGLNKIDEKLNHSEETSCTSSVVSFTKSSSNSSSTSSSAFVSNSPPSTTNSELESNSTPSSSSSIMSQSLIVTNDVHKQSKYNMSKSIHVESSKSNQQSRSSRIINSIIKMSTTAAAVGSTGSSINFESSASSKVPLFTTTLSSSKIKPTKGFNSTYSMNNKSIGTTAAVATTSGVATTKSLYSICDLKSPSNGNIQQKQQLKMTSDNLDKQTLEQQQKQQVNCNGLKTITMSCLKIDSIEKMNNVNEWPIEKVRVWLEQIGMLQSHIKNGLKSIKNGKSLLNMSDGELERAFQINNNLHKRKLKLAIDELKYPEKCKFTKINDLNTDWVCNIWLKDIGLVQYRSVFRLNLIDGRLLNSLTKKDLEKYLNINRRSIQISLLIGIELLRKFEFDIEKLKSAREMNGQPNEIYLWTNEHFDDWLRLVNLQAFARNLAESGIHGALVQDNLFNVDYLYSSLKVTEESRYINMKKILEDEIKLLKKSKNDFKSDSSTTTTFNRSIKQDKKLFTLRGSLGRALGKKIKRDISSPLIDDDTYRRIEFSHKIVDMKNVSTTSVV